MRGIRLNWTWDEPHEYSVGYFFRDNCLLKNPGIAGKYFFLVSAEEDCFQILLEMEAFCARCTDLSMEDFDSRLTIEYVNVPDEQIIFRDSKQFVQRI